MGNAGFVSMVVSRERHRELELAKLDAVSREKLVQSALAWRARNLFTVVEVLISQVGKEKAKELIEEAQAVAGMGSAVCELLSAEFPEYVNTKYNDKVTITVDSASQGITERIIAVNDADVQVWSSDMQGTGFDIFSIEANPDKVDIVNLTPILGGDDAGATPLQLFEHPVAPGEIVTITFKIEDVGDNLFDSTVFIDSLGFSEEMQRDIIARKSAYDENDDLVDGSLECGSIIKYIIKLNNIGQASQFDNPGDEFVDSIPDNTTYVSGSAIASSGSISFNPTGNNITWNGMIPPLSTVTLEFQVIIIRLGKKSRKK